MGTADDGGPRAHGGVHRRRRRPGDVSVALSADRIATWSGHSYAVEVVDQLGLADSGGVVRAGVVAYITDDDVARLLASVERIAARVSG